jgi:hypothetical protein
MATRKFSNAETGPMPMVSEAIARPMTPAATQKAVHASMNLLYPICCALG